MEDIYETKDLYIASVLQSLDILPNEVEREFDGKRNIATFIYNKNLKKIARIIKDYYDGQLLIEPQKLFYSMKLLKNRIYE